MQLCWVGVGQAMGARRAGRRRIGDNVSVMRWLLVPALLLLLLILALGFVARRPAEAQEVEPSVFVDLRLTETSRGAYRLDVELQGDVVPYRVTAMVQPIGADQESGVLLAEGDDARMSIDLPLPLDGMKADGGGCYIVNFDVAPQDDANLGVIEDAALEAYACVEADGTTTFPAYDGVQEPPPAPPSNVRVVREPTVDGDTWIIKWEPSAEGRVVAYDPGVLLFDRPWNPSVTDVTGYGGIEMPMQPANWTQAGAINFFFVPEGPDLTDEEMCGYALVLVWAIGADGSSALPGNTTVSACFRRGQINFPYVDANGVVLPEAGDGAASTDDSAHHRRLRLAAGLALGAVGVAVVAAGASSARR